MPRVLQCCELMSVAGSISVSAIKNTNRKIDYNAWPPQTLAHSSCIITKTFPKKHIILFGKMAYHVITIL